MARTSKLTKRVQASIITAILNGHYLASAAKTANVARSTVYRWLERGRAERERRENGLRANRKEARYLSFLEIYETAEYEPENLAVSVLFEVMQDKEASAHARVRAAHIFLARRYPERWGNRIVEPEQPTDSGYTTSAESARAKIMAMIDRSDSFADHDDDEPFAEEPLYS